MSWSTNFELNTISGISANVLKLFDKPEAGNRLQFRGAWSKVNHAWIPIMSLPTKFKLDAISGLCSSVQQPKMCDVWMDRTQKWTKPFLCPPPTQLGQFSTISLYLQLDLSKSHFTENYRALDTYSCCVTHSPTLGKNMMRRFWYLHEKMFILTNLFNSFVLESISSRI